MGWSEVKDEGKSVQVTQRAQWSHQAFAYLSLELKREVRAGATPGDGQDKGVGQDISLGEGGHPMRGVE